MINTSCILTVIKNEQEYLDEWIKYHLDLGINHIFIFEDLDSDSHKEITDKYTDNVTLNSVSTILNEEDKKLVFELKLSRKKNPQEIYFPKCLNYIKNLYADKYDWCFVIDNDEFITFQNEDDDIKNILSKYKDYDAVILQWKIYGANGYINKPDYINKGLLKTYTKESKYPGHDRLEWTTKTCYKLSSFNETKFKDAHQPTDKCKWCRTDFSNIRTKIVYDRIYIKHYMTKSWEEYINKRKRGYFMGYARTIDVFFKINPDMLHLKQQLLNDLKKEILVILPYKQSSSQGNEIRLALSGWKMFCQFKYHFVVIGEFDKSLKNDFHWVEFIYCPTIVKIENQYNPHLDMQNKFNIVMKKYDKMYDGFIWMVDDNYAIKPFSLEDITTIHYHSLSFTGDKKAPINFWNHDKWKTRQLLDKYNLPHVNYTTHYPCYFEFNKLKEILDRFNMRNESYVLEDIYFNYFKHEEPVLDSTIRLGIWSNNIYKNEFKNAIENPNIKFVCNSVDGWSKELEKSLENIINKED